MVNNAHEFICRFSLSLMSSLDLDFNIITIHYLFVTRIHGVVG